MQYKYYDRVRVPKYVVGRKKYQGDQIDRLVDLANRSLPVFHDLLEFSDDLIITLKPMGRVVCGIYDPNVDVVEIDHRRSNEIDFLSVLAHELVHAEQYYQRRLDSEWDGVGYLYRWNQAYYCVLEKDYNRYIPPWEIEALERQYGLALTVCAELGV